MARRPAVVVFDVNETLFGLDQLGDAFEEAGLPGAALDLWFSRSLADGFALAAAGDFAPFAELAHTHLTRILRSYGLPHDLELVEELLDAFHDLDVYEDVAPALERLRDEGVTAVTLTNGSAEITRSLLASHRLEGLVARCFDVAEVGAWKPRPEPYVHVATELEVDVADCALVAVHSWDIHGAKRAGMTTAWVGRLEGDPLPQMVDADVQGRSLTEAVDALLAL